MAEQRADQVIVFTVWELTRSIRSVLESEVGSVWVEGEVSNYRKQASGHQYFTLKDDRSQLPCVLFRGNNDLLTSPNLADGMHVQAFGELTVYELRGQYQMIVQMVQGKGVGALQARFEALKRKLDAEGLFAPERKKPLPVFPTRVGIVTSPTGAALQDMLNVLQRRAPWLRIVVYPVRVQGFGAAAEVAHAVREFNRWAAPSLRGGVPTSRPSVDLIVVARGGGSMEDLFEFNDETLARTIAASKLPVVSAVGHEIDFTIADFVADLRAPTPSAAAELIVPDAVSLQRQLAAAAQFLDRRLLDYVERARERLRVHTSGALFREPLRRILEARQQLDSADESLRRWTHERLGALRADIEARECSLRVSGPARALQIHARDLRGQADRFEAAFARSRENVHTRMREAQRILRVLAPQATLERGFSITTDEEDRIIRSVSNVTPGRPIRTRLPDGTIISTVS